MSTIRGMGRRRFLSTAAALGTTLWASSRARAFGANDRVRLAVLGVNGRGKDHVRGFSALEGVEVAAIVDPDRRTYGNALKAIQGAPASPPATVQDLRRVLEDRTIDAVSIATPNHWHSLAGIWACEAEKDVYVEKPCSHEVREGRLLVEAARRFRRIVQHGTQSRSAGSVRSAIEYLRSGQLGEVYLARGLCYKRRGSIGFKPPAAPPSEVDFDLWLGPAREQPYHENLVHYNWHWMWDTGNGDIGNQGVHEMDVARWGLGVGLPRAVQSFGGRFGYEDQGETANTQVAVFDYGARQLIFEVRGLETPGLFGASGVGNIFHGAEGTLIVGKGVLRKGSSELEPIPESAKGEDHFGNFIRAVRARDPGLLSAEILEGHLSSALCHLANISYRLGEPTPFPELPERLGSDARASAHAGEALGRMEAHLEANGVKAAEVPCRLGRALSFLPDEERFQDDLVDAQKLLERIYRKPFAPAGALSA